MVGTIILIMFVVFGCAAWAYNSKEGKWADKRVQKCIVLGLDPYKKPYILYNPDSKKLVTSVHITFDEGSYPFKNEQYANDPFLVEKESSESPKGDYGHLFTTDGDFSLGKTEKKFREN